VHSRKQIGLIDLEGTKMDARDPFKFVSYVAHYLIRSLPVIADGNTVGGSR